MDARANPFRPGAGTRPPLLVGRNDLLDRFDVAAYRARARRPGKSVVPVGLRGAGKTVLLNQFAAIARDHDFAVGHIETPEPGNLIDLTASQVQRLLLELSAKHRASQAIQQALATLASFTVHLPDSTRLSVGVDPARGTADTGVFEFDLTNLLVAVGEAAADCNQGAVLIVDELQYADTEQFAALIVAIHRTTQLDLPVLLTGAGLPQLPGLAGDAKTYAERLFEFPTVGPLALDETAAAVNTPAQAEGGSFTDAAIEALHDHTKGYPYFVQEWAYHSWNQAEQPTISEDDVVGAEPLVRKQLDENFFRVRFDRLTNAEREYLAAMARLGPGPHRSGRIAAQLGVRPTTVAPRRRSLIRKGMIYAPEYGLTAFTVPMFDEFMLRQASS